MDITKKAIDWQSLSGNFESKFGRFFKKFKIATLAHDAYIHKAKGTSAISIFIKLFLLPFIKSNIYRNVVINKLSDVKKDAIYDFLQSYKFNWRRFLLKLSLSVFEYYNNLTDEGRDSVFIIDDSTIERKRSKRVELLAKIYDHTQSRYLKGFKLLTFAWSDGASLIPLDFILRSSANSKNRYQESTKIIDKRTCGAIRRKEAITKSTDLIVPAIKRALAAGIKAKYVLMDSWFAMPSLISNLYNYINVVCMLKRTSKVSYVFEGKTLNLMQIYSQVRKRRGRAKILASAIISFKDKLKAKIVFVRNRNVKSDWLAIITTDINLKDEDVVRIYGKRWDIEVFFRTAKQHLELENGFQGRDYDSLVAHTTIVMTRYIFLSIEQRMATDHRTLGLLFHACCGEADDYTFSTALNQIAYMIGENLMRNLDNQIKDNAVIYQVFSDVCRSYGLNFDSFSNDHKGLALVS